MYCYEIVFSALWEENRSNVFKNIMLGGTLDINRKIENIGFGKYAK
jgi:hypothetical protein